MPSSAISAPGSILAIGTGTGGAKTITAMAAGNPTIFTSAAHGFVNGDVITIAALVGTAAASFNGLTFSVVSKTTNTFALQVDTTGLTYTSGGTATPLRRWVLRSVRANASAMAAERKPSHAT